MSKSLREHSRIGYAGPTPPQNPSLEQINAGSLQRIADATEKMAASYTDMERSRNYWRNYATELAQRNRTLRRRVASLRGWITRLKRKK